MARRGVRERSEIPGWMLGWILGLACSTIETLSIKRTPSLVIFTVYRLVSLKACRIYRVLAMDFVSRLTCRNSISSRLSTRFSSNDSFSLDGRKVVWLRRPRFYANLPTFLKDLSKYFHRFPLSPFRVHPVFVPCFPLKRNSRRSN